MTAARQLLDLVRGGLLRDPSLANTPLPAAAQTMEHVRRNGMEPMLFTSLLERGQSPQGEWAGVQDAYLTATLEHNKRLQTGIRLAEQLESNGIPAICYRGPFSGLRLYNDIATRPFQDIDLIVPDDQAEAAYELALRSGFQSQQEGVPSGFFRRHHIHWALHSNGTLLDLHWRVEHPYTLYKIDYAEIFADSRMVTHQGFTWREPNPVHLFLLCCSQLTKTEPAALHLAQDAAASDHLFRQRLLWKWMDIARLWQEEDLSAQSATLVEIARRWRMDASLSAGLAGLQNLFGIQIPESLVTSLQQTDAWPVQTPAYAPEFQGPGFLSKFALKRGGFRFNRINDIGRFLLPPTDFFSHGTFGSTSGASGIPIFLQRIIHFLTGVARMAFVAVDVVWTLGLRRIFQKKAHAAKPVLLRT